MLSACCANRILCANLAPWPAKRKFARKRFVRENSQTMTMRGPFTAARSPCEPFTVGHFCCGLSFSAALSLIARTPSLGLLRWDSTAGAGGGFVCIRIAVIQKCSHSCNRSPFDPPFDQPLEVASAVHGLAASQSLISDSPASSIFCHPF